MDLTAVQTPLAGLVAGLVTSLHCAGMCGPLACALLPAGGPGKGSPQTALALYHAGRIVSYALVGALAGAFGAAVAGIFSFPVTAYLPWALVVLFLVFIFGWEKQVPLPVAVSRAVFRLRLRAGKLSRPILGSSLGLLTPFLPCAPLYILFGVALFTGSATGGGLLLAAFAAGTVIPLWIVQAQFFRLRTRLSPVALGRIQKALALVSLVLVAWRATAGDGFSPDETATVSCPFH